MSSGSSQLGLDPLLVFMEIVNKTNIKCKEEKNAISERISAHCGQCTAGFSETYLMENLSLKVR